MPKAHFVTVAYVDEMADGNKTLTFKERQNDIGEFSAFCTFFKILLAVNFSLIISDVITEVLSSLLTGKAINELFTGRICFWLMI